MRIYVLDPNTSPSMNTLLDTAVRPKVISSDDPTRSIEVAMTDRGPYAAGRVIDLTPAAFRKLFGTTNRGVAHVIVIVPRERTTR